MPFCGNKTRSFNRNFLYVSQKESREYSRDGEDSTTISFKFPASSGASYGAASIVGGVAWGCVAGRGGGRQ